MLVRIVLDEERGAKTESEKNVLNINVMAIQCIVSNY